MNDYARNAKNKANTNPAYVPQPFFLTLNFVNPHDKQWFWGAMEADNFYKVYDAVHQKYPNEVAPGPYLEIVPQDQPKTVYPTAVDPSTIVDALPNWQDQDALDLKPKAQTLVKEVFQYQMGGIHEDDQRTKQNYVPVDPPAGFAYADAPAHQPDHKAVAPFTYWTRSLDSYVQLMTMVDTAIGNFMDSISEEVRQNTIFVFTSDHGEYGSSHGLQGKGGTVYDEGIRVPLVVRDSRPNSYATDPKALRTQLTSSVDLLPMIVTMGNGGSTAWMTGNEYEQLYGNGKRWDLLSILGKHDADGRTYALHSTDEFIPDVYNFNGAPLHVIGLIQTDAQGRNKTKLGVYTNWITPSASPDQATVINPLTFVNPPLRSLEFYDRTQFNDESLEPLEILSTPDSTEARNANAYLFDTLIPTELQAPLPTQTLQEAQTSAYHDLIDYMQLVNDMSNKQTQTSPAPEEVKVLLARAWAL